MSSTTHPCPYIAHFGTIHPSSSASSGNVSDGSNFSNHWSGLSAPSEVRNLYAFPSMDGHHHNIWEHPSHFAASNRIGSADQPPIPSVTQRTARSSDIPRHGMHPFIVGHSAAIRALPYPGPVARPRDHPPLQAYFQQSSSALASGRRSVSHRGLPQVAPVASSSDGFYFFSSNPSGISFQDAENPPRDHFQGWENEQPAGFPVAHVDRDSIWAPFHHPSPDSGVRPRQRHGSERMPSQNRT